jgi:hypothetical protein
MVTVPTEAQGELHGYMQLESFDSIPPSFFKPTIDVFHRLQEVQPTLPLTRAPGPTMSRELRRGKADQPRGQRSSKRADDKHHTLHGQDVS